MQRIVARLSELTDQDPRRFRDYLSTLEILSSNRDLQAVVKEAEAMLSEIKVTELPSYALGMERGEERGIAKGLQRGQLQGLREGVKKGKLEGLRKGRLEGKLEGKRALLLRQLQRRFGPVPAEFQTRVEHASSDDLARWSDQIFDAHVLEDVFA